MSSFLEFLSTYLKTHPLPDLKEQVGLSAFKLGAWIVIRNLCLEHQETVFYRQRKLSLLFDETKPYKDPHFLHAYFESEEGYCFNLNGTISLKEIEMDFVKNAMPLAPKASGTTLPPKLKMEIISDPPFITQQNSKRTEFLKDWLIDFEKAWLNQIISAGKPNPSPIRL